MEKKSFYFSPSKNAKLIDELGISFDEVISAINEGCLLDVIPHHNKDKYPNQDILVVKMNNYIFLVPCLEKEDGRFFLKTIIPSRKHTKLYLKK